MSNVRITEPTIEPVSVEDFKIFAKITDSMEDSQIEELISAARVFFELTTGLALIEQQWRLTVDSLVAPGGSAAEPWWDGVREGAISELSPMRNWVELPVAPLISIDSFSAFAADNTSTPFTQFYSDLDSKPGRLILNTGAVWPIATRNTGRYQIVYTAGFGDSADNVPTDIRLCIKQLALHFYENRELMTFDTSAVQVPVHCLRIMNRRKMKRV